NPLTYCPFIIKEKSLACELIHLNFRPPIKPPPTTPIKKAERLSVLLLTLLFDCLRHGAHDRYFAVTRVTETNFLICFTIKLIPFADSQLFSINREGALPFKHI